MNENTIERMSRIQANEEDAKTNMLYRLELLADGYCQGQIDAFELLKRRKRFYVIDDKWIDYKLRKLKSGQGTLSGKTGKRNSSPICF